MCIKKAQRIAYQVLSSKQSNMNAYIHESINGIKVTQSFSREEENQKIFGMVNNEYRKSWLRAVVTSLLLWPSVDTISSITVSAVYAVGVSFIEKGVTVGIIVAFVGYIWRFWMLITNIGNFYNSLINAMAYLERIFETMDEKPLVENAIDAKELPVYCGIKAFLFKE